MLSEHNLMLRTELVRFVPAPQLPSSFISFYLWLLYTLKMLKHMVILTEGGQLVLFQLYIH